MYPNGSRVLALRRSIMYFSGDFHEFERYYLYKFKQYESSVGKAIRDKQLKEIQYAETELRDDSRQKIFT